MTAISEFDSQTVAQTAPSTRRGPSAKLVSLLMACAAVTATAAAPASAVAPVIQAPQFSPSAQVPAFSWQGSWSGIRLNFTFTETATIAATSAMWPVLAAASAVAPWASPALIWGSGRIVWAAITAVQMNKPPRCLTIYITYKNPKGFTTGTYACSSR